LSRRHAIGTTAAVDSAPAVDALLQAIVAEAARDPEFCAQLDADIGELVRRRADIIERLLSPGDARRFVGRGVIEVDSLFALRCASASA
jgi:hypothetical protein